MRNFEEKAPGCAIALWLFAMLFNLVFWGAVGYVAFHFISKYW